MSVPRYTTPTFTLEFSEEGLDLTQASGVYVTFKQASQTMTKTGSDLEVQEKSIGVFMSQAETAKFCVGGIEIQANWTMADGRRAASEVVDYEISEQLLPEVI